jgi:hypothetical protein
MALFENQQNRGREMSKAAEVTLGGLRARGDAELGRLEWFLLRIGTSGGEHRAESVDFLRDRM